MFWRLTNKNFNIRLLDVKNEKYNGLLAGVSFPTSSRAPRVSVAPKTPFPYPFKRLPRRLVSPAKHRIKWRHFGTNYLRPCRVIETFSGRRQLQPDVTSSFVGYCACSCSPPCHRGPVGDVKLVSLALWRKREYLTFISIRFVAFSNQHFADYRS